MFLMLFYGVSIIGLAALLVGFLMLAQREWSQAGESFGVAGLMLICLMVIIAAEAVTQSGGL